jgi:hypothetical protein
MEESNVQKLIEKARNLIGIYSEKKADGTIKKLQLGSFQDVVANIGLFREIISKVISAVEVASAVQEDLKSADKLEAAAQLLDDMLVLPWYLEAVDGTIIRITLSLVVEFFNTMQQDKKFGVAEAKRVLESSVS